jgi:hypothetical protein
VAVGQVFIRALQFFPTNYHSTNAPQLCTYNEGLVQVTTVPVCDDACVHYHVTSTRKCTRVYRGPLCSNNEMACLLQCTHGFVCVCVCVKHVTCVSPISELKIFFGATARLFIFSGLFYDTIGNYTIQRGIGDD